MTVSEIRGMRRELGLTQAQLAGALGVHPNTLARWERGEITPQYPIMLRHALLYLLEMGKINEIDEIDELEETVCVLRKEVSHLTDALKNACHKIGRMQAELDMLKEEKGCE